MDDRPVRKPNRLKENDYSQNGAYFITFCIEGRHQMLCELVGDGVLDVPQIQLSTYGKIVKEQLDAINTVYHDIFIDKYVIMPNHVHFIVFVNNAEERTACNGTSRMPSPTNAVIPRLLSTVKRLVNRCVGENIWQRSYYDHVIRNEADYLRIWEYIDTNPAKWKDDRYFIEE